MLRRKIPDLFTLANLVSGCIALRFVFEEELSYAALFILLSAVFDFLDGLAARTLGVNNAHGKDLDSLADVVSFGVLPGFLAMELIRMQNDTLLDSMWIWGFEQTEALNSLSYIAFLMPALSAYRLAKFNHDTRQTDSFIGLATPANALFWCGLVVGIENGSLNLLANPIIVVFLTVIFSLLLLSPLPMFSFKMKHPNWIGNEMRYIFLALCTGIMVYMGIAGLTACIVLYVMLSLANSIRGNKDNAANTETAI
jgi:CDP-diacylglycerol--serine O-phosphatidyltransferase